MKGRSTQVERMLLVMILFLLATPLFAGDPAQLWVSTKGSDTAEGTEKHPLLTLDMALRKAREMRRLAEPAAKDGIHIIIEGGTYRLNEPIRIRPEDSGTAGSPTIIRSAGTGQPVLSGGKVIRGWIRKGNLWEADAPTMGTDVIDFRQLWVNNRKATRARDYNDHKMGRILSWDHVSRTCMIPFPKKWKAEQLVGAEMVILQWWAIANLRIKEVKVMGDSARLSFYDPESRVQSEHPWPAPWISKETGNSAFYLTNSRQFLDQPGEWYLDKRAGKVYYWPLPSEQMTSATVVAPYLETLLKMEGTIDRPVSHVYFKGISFQHASWLRPSQYGHVPHQAGMYMLDAYKLQVPGTADKKGLENQAWVGRPAAAVEVLYAHHTGFEACRFEHHASTGLDYKKGTHHNLIIGNLFKDIGGTGIQVGTFSEESVEAHLPYDPADEREISTNETIANNLITDVTNEDWGCVGIGAGHVRGINIVNNEISNVSYSGISMGWGWTRTINAMRNNTIRANKIHHYGMHLYDVSAIYTLSAQPGSVIAENVIDSIYQAPYAHDPHHWFYLYTDEGSSYFSIRDNWTPAEKFLQNANGPGNTWENNGPLVADSIRARAGIQPPYQYLLKDRSPAAPHRKINQYVPEDDKPSLIEIASANADAPDAQLLKRIAGEFKLPAGSLYQWNNRAVIYARLKDPRSLRANLAANFPKATVKLYTDRFYSFDRQTHCAENQLKEQDQVILTAKLVRNPGLQKEYFSHYATQFEKWPEVARGLCQAGFQSVVMFREEDQLMLIISLPKGRTSDQLNAKTLENNPKVQQWNKMIRKYEEGQPGAKTGQTWSLFKHLN
ncbi:MAG: L-rhamnose mutarotase [Arcticibacter sp.]